MGMQIAEAWVDIRGNMSHLKNTFAKTKGMASRAGRGVAEAFASAAKLGIAGGIAAGGSAFGLIKMASSAEEAASKFSVVFQGVENDARSFSDSLADTVGRSKVEMAGFLADIGDVAKPMGLSTEAALEFSKSVVSLGLDLASFNDDTDTEALERLKGALIGNHENVRRYGIVLTEATLNAELFRMGIEGGTKSASEQQKMMARLSLITKGSADAIGDAARTSGSFANQFKALRGMAFDFGTELGAKLLPAATQFVQFLKGGIEPLQNFINTNWEQIKVWGSLALKIGAVITAMGAAVIAVGTLATPVGALVAGIALLTGAFFAAGGSASELDDMLSNWGEGLIDAIDRVMVRFQEMRDWLTQEFLNSPFLAELFDIDLKGVEEGKRKIERIKANDLKVINEQRIASGKKPLTAAELAEQRRRTGTQGGNVQAGGVNEEFEQMKSRRAPRVSLKERLATMKEQFQIQPVAVPTVAPTVAPKPSAGPTMTERQRLAAMFQGGFLGGEEPTVEGGGTGLQITNPASHGGVNSDGFTSLSRSTQGGRSAASFSGVAELARSIQGGLGSKENKQLKASEQTAKNTQMMNQKLNNIEEKLPQAAVFG